MAGCGLSALLLMAVTTTMAQQPKPQQTPAQQVRRYFDGVNKQVLEMAEDFPADKYDFRLKPEMRSFGEVIVHVTSGIAYAAKAGRGEKVQWDEIDAKDYKTKDQIVALLQKWIGDANATLKSVPEDSFAKNLQPWLSVIEHSGEHYGLLVAYYRANGMVPPASRPQKK